MLSGGMTVALATSSAGRSVAALIVAAAVALPRGCAAGAFPRPVSAGVQALAKEVFP